MNLPTDLAQFLAQPRIAVLATVRRDGAPATTACWYDLQDGKILITMYADARRLPNIKQDPRVAMTIVGDDPYQHVSLAGQVVHLVVDRGGGHVDSFGDFAAEVADELDAE